MKVSEIKGEKAIQTLGDILEPTMEILADESIKKAYEKNKTNLDIAKIILKDHSKSVIEILAALDGVPADKYECNLLSLPSKLMEVLNDEAIQQFFTSQMQTEDATSSASALQNTEEN